MDLMVGPIARVLGKIEVPGDKSLSHRAAILGALAVGQTKIEGFLPSADCLSTLACLNALGTKIVGDPAQGLIITGGRWREPETILDAGNSGTTLRLLAGALAGFDFFSILDGDASLRGRPMSRIVQPLRQMGATIDGRDGGSKAPLALRGGPLRGITYVSPVASAQVKSAVLLAGLNAQGRTRYVEPHLSRDHTERMLTYFGLPIQRQGNMVILEPGPLQGRSLQIPGDISSAAFFMVAAALGRDSQLEITGVGVNPTRTGIITVLSQMGCHIELRNPREWGGEPVADLLVESRPLRGVTIGADLVPSLIDELPILAVAASQAVGRTRVSGAAELRVKETDRIDVLAQRLGALGIKMVTKPDGFIIDGPQQITGGLVDAGGDHRLAMSLAVAGLFAQGETKIKGFECADISFPGFVEVLEKLGVELQKE
ncbi:MAG: 3-phosphoshikimate 1-carboxyvinyltransferase [Limnochordia bacterium]|jgi:3-phosphoshikimate 1-carboxyvinyltransferase